MNVGWSAISVVKKEWLFLTSTILPLYIEEETKTTK